MWPLKNWQFNKPQNLGGGILSEIERRSYLPEWLQHEFFYYFFNIYEDQNLEPNGHDWFKRSFWPNDFIGNYEEDYYKEALEKRIKTSSPTSP